MAIFNSNADSILETIRMIEQEHLDIRTVTMGISLLDCADSDIDVSCRKVYEKITTKAKHLVQSMMAILFRLFHQPVRTVLSQVMS